MNSIFTRRSIRVFEDREVEQEKIESLLRAGMQAPSAHNGQPWEFVVIRDSEKSRDISEMSPYGKLAAKAPVNLILLANLDGRPQGETWWVQDLSACAQNILLQAVEEGLGATWIGFYPEDRSETLRSYLELPEHMVPFCVISVGYSTRENKFKDRYVPEKVHWDAYSK